MKHRILLNPECKVSFYHKKISRTFSFVFLEKKLKFIEKNKNTFRMAQMTQSTAKL